MYMYFSGLTCGYCILQQFPSVVVAYSLKAMQYSSKVATQRFPRLLQIVELHPDTLEAFKKKVNCFSCNIYKKKCVEECLRIKLSTHNKVVLTWDKAEGIDNLHNFFIIYTMLASSPGGCGLGTRLILCMSESKL